MNKIILILLFSFNSYANGEHLGGAMGGGSEEDRVIYESGSGFAVEEQEEQSDEE